MRTSRWKRTGAKDICKVKFFLVVADDIQVFNLEVKHMAGESKIGTSGRSCWFRDANGVLIFFDWISPELRLDDIEMTEGKKYIAVITKSHRFPEKSKRRLLNIIDYVGKRFTL